MKERLNRHGMKRWNYLHNEKMKIREGWGGGNARIKLQYACGIAEDLSNAVTYLGHIHKQETG